MGVFFLLNIGCLVKSCFRPVTLRMGASKLGDKLRLGVSRPPSCKIGWKQHTGQNGNSKYLKLKLKLRFHGGGDGKST